MAGSGLPHKSATSRWGSPTNLPKLKQFCKTGEKVIGQHRGKTLGWVEGVKEEMGAVIQHRHSKREVSGFDPRTLTRGSNGEHRGPHWGQHRVTIPICNCNMASCSLGGIFYCHTVFIAIRFLGLGSLETWRWSNGAMGGHFLGVMINLAKAHIPFHCWLSKLLLIYFSRLFLAIQKPYVTSHGMDINCVGRQ